jgi:periplasmic mercuric ion binding protein
MKKLTTLVSVFVLGTTVWAAPQTITLSIPTMNCATCPITAKKALNKVAGVLDVKSDLGKRETTVTFDNAKAKVAALTRATGEAGFPSTPIEKAQ